VVSVEAGVERNHLFVVKTRMREQGALERPDQESRYDEEYAACRDLCPNKDLPRDGRTKALAASLQRWRQPEQDRGDEPHPDGEEHDPPIRHRIQPRSFGPCHQGPKDKIAKGQPCDRSDERQQQAFGKQLANQPAATGPDGGTNRHLLLPRHVSRQEQAPQITARDSKNQQTQGAQQSKYGVDAAPPSTCRSRGVGAPLTEKPLVFLDIVGMHLPQLCRQRPQFFLRHASR
jgi:hypothetical protein